MKNDFIEICIMAIGVSVFATVVGGLIAWGIFSLSNLIL